MLKKACLLFCGISLISIYSYSQAPKQFLRLQQQYDETWKMVDNKSIGPKNLWIGAVQACYSLTSDPIADNLQFSSQTTIEVFPIGNHFSLYFLGNLNPLFTDTNSNTEEKIKKIQQSSEGLTLAVFPTLYYGDSKKSSLSVYGIVGYKVNALKDEKDELVYLNQGYIGIGLELSGLLGTISGLPITLTVEPRWNLLSEEIFENIFGNKRASLFGFNATMIIPFGSGKGIVVDFLTSAEFGSKLKIGLIISSILN